MTWHHGTRDNVDKNFVDYRNQLMAILNQESSLMEIVKLIGSDVLPDDQKLTLEIARVIRLGFLQQNAFHKDDTCVPIRKAVPDDGSDPVSEHRRQKPWLPWVCRCPF